MLSEGDKTVGNSCTLSLCEVLVSLLDDEVLDVARRIALIPSDIVQLNKRTVHRAMDTMGLRTSIRNGTELCSLGIHQETFTRFIDGMHRDGLTQALSERDEPFGDYRTRSGG